MKLKCLVLFLLLFLCPFSSAFAEDGVLNSGDTAWIIVSTALVMMMTPAGLALFYGGMSRYKNLLNTLAMTFVTYCLVSVIWVIWGYSLAFGESSSVLIGSFSHILLAGIDVNSISGSIPTILFVLFQMTFACITVALILGSIVDRMKFSAWIVFTILWVTFIYTPVCNWAWGGGFQRDRDPDCHDTSPFKVNRRSGCERSQSSPKDYARQASYLTTFLKIWSQTTP